MKEMVGGCCVCSDDRGWPENPLVYCDGQSCNVAVHQACYGIVTVPTGPWYCRKCESQERTARVKCELCPSRYGALKRTDNSGWAHVVCALYIPEVRFGNVTTMEPIQLQLIPSERFNKVCYICEEQGKATSSAVGACMQCNKSGCKQQFHVTCAQTLGLLCEEAGNYLDNVKYCGYCQHHYSKLKKGGNVKTIPPYKPVSTENHLSDSNSEKEPEPNNPTSNAKSASQSSVSNKRNKSTSNTKSSVGPKSAASAKASANSSHQKTVHSSNNKSEKDKPKITNSNIRSAKSVDESVVLNNSESSGDTKTDKSVTDRSVPSVKEVKTEIEPDTVKVEPKETKTGKKRKVNSRTPTPVSVPTDSVSVVLSAITIPPSALTDTSSSSGAPSGNVSSAADKKENITSSETDKIKKVKTEHNLLPIISQPIVALTNTILPSSVKTITLPITTTDSIPATTVTVPVSNTISIVQSTSNLPINSLVVSVPLINTKLSSPSHISSNQSNIVAPSSTYPHPTQERTPAVASTAAERSTPSNSNNNTNMTGGSSAQSTGIITSEMSGGGLKITYEKQPPSNSNNSSQMELECVTPSETDAHSKRPRSLSVEKRERVGRAKKRGTSGPSTSISKRTNRSQHHALSPPQAASVPQIKDSPPSSPSSESQSALPAPGRGRTKGRKSAPASVSSSSSSNKDTKDNLKVFQNGVAAPHMLGNQLNPNSNMAQKMTDHLNSELEAHSIFSPNDSQNLIGPQLHHRVIANARSSSAGGSSTASGGSGFSMLGGSGGSIPQTLDQLLERQWEQGSQFLMEQAQHFDIASLLSCLHQLRAENLRLEEHVSSLLQRRDHLLAVNARLAIPLTGQPATSQSTHPHTVNNIHPAVIASHSDVPRSSRHGGNYQPHTQISTHATGPVENGLPTDPNQVYPHQHRSPANNQPPGSSSVRHVPAGSAAYSNSALICQNVDGSRSQPYPVYQGPGPSNTQSQMVIRRESALLHQPSSKPS